MRAGREGLMGLALPAALAFVVATWSLAPGLSEDVVPIWPGAEFTDLTTAHLPTAEFIHRAWVDYGSFPTWNPTILSGMPVLSDPLSSVFYPPGWPLIAWPTPRVATALAILHITFGAMGTALLLRRRSISTAATSTAAVAFAGLPKLVGQFALGHLTLVYAFSWTPWLVWACDRSIEGDRERVIGLRWVAVTTVLWSMMALADVRWAIMGGLLGLAYLLRRLEVAHIRDWKGLAKGGLIGLLGAMTIPAVHLLPLWLWLGSSVRAALTLSERLELSLPPVQLAGVLFPPWGTWPEWLAYAGVAVVILGLLAAIGRPDGAWFWWIVLIVAALLSLGGNLPLLGPLMFRMPGLSSLRVPARFLFLSGMALSVLAGLGVESFADHDLISLATRRRMSVGLIAVGAVVAGSVIVPGIGSSLGTGLKKGLLLLACVALASAALLFLSATKKHTRGRWTPWVWAVLVAAELAIFNRSLIATRAMPALPQRLMELIDRSGESRFRLFSPSLSVPPLPAAQSGLELAHGVQPLISGDYWEYMAKATGYDPEGYSVTLPPFRSGNPHEPWDFEPHSELLGELNVLYVVSEYEVSADGWLPSTEWQSPDLYVYENEDWRPRAWVENEAGISSAELTWSPGHLSVRATGPGTLLISELALPGWRTSLDGNPAERRESRKPLIAVDLPAGEHEVQLTYRTPGALLGIALTTLGLMIVGWTAWRG